MRAFTSHRMPRLWTMHARRYHASQSRMRAIQTAWTCCATMASSAMPCNWYVHTLYTHACKLNVASNVVFGHPKVTGTYVKMQTVMLLLL